jgi:hypothetical protein
MKLWRLLALVLVALIIVYALLIDDAREHAKLQRDVDAAEARRRWAAVEYMRHSLEQNGVECRRDAC